MTLCYRIGMAPPKSTNPKKNFVSFRYTDAEAAPLDALARRTGRSRSDLVREAVGQYVARETARTAKKRASKRTSRG